MLLELNRSNEAVGAKQQKKFKIESKKPVGLLV
jgi:hypothetical protein